MGVLGSIFGFGDTLKRRLKDAASNPRDFTEMAIDQNQNEWRKNPTRGPWDSLTQFLLVLWGSL